MRRILFTIISCIVCVAANAATAPTPAPRISIFSTSTDWEAVTGLTLNEYRGRFKMDKKLVGRGLTLYYLDGFPCYGLGQGVRVWIGPDWDEDSKIWLACVVRPTEIKFAWRNMARDASQATTTGILTCPVNAGTSREFEIDLSKCVKGPDWPDYK